MEARESERVEWFNGSIEMTHTGAMVRDSIDWMLHCGKRNHKACRELVNHGYGG